MSNRFKQLLRQLGSLCLAGTIVVSCQPNEPQVAHLSDKVAPVTVQDGLLKFASAEAYDKLIRDRPSFHREVTSRESFRSLESALPQNRRNARIGEKQYIPAPLAQMLNADGMVQIGNWVFKMLFETRTILVAEASRTNNELLENLRQGNLVSGIRKFSFDDEVLYLLTSGSSATDPTGLFCSGGIGGQDPHRHERFLGVVCMAAVHDYDKYGIFFEAFSYIKYCDFVVSPPYFSGHVLYVTCQYRTNCGRTGDFIVPATPVLFSTWNGWDYGVLYNTYQGTTGLRELYLSSAYRVGGLVFQPTDINVRR